MVQSYCCRCPNGQPLGRRPPYTTEVVLELDIVCIHRGWFTTSNFVSIAALLYRYDIATKIVHYLLAVLLGFTNRMFLQDVDSTKNSVSARRLHQWFQLANNPVSLFAHRFFGLYWTWTQQPTTLVYNLYHPWEERCCWVTSTTVINQIVRTEPSFKFLLWLQRVSSWFFNFLWILEKFLYIMSTSQKLLHQFVCLIGYLLLLVIYVSSLLSQSFQSSDCQ